MNQNTKQPHKHAETIKAWADGAEIEILFNHTGEWTRARNPQWTEDFEYRIKPAEPERVYPETKLSFEELKEMSLRLSSRPTDPVQDRRDIINEAFKKACDASQIVTRAEFDRAVGDRKARDMAVAKAVDAWYAKTFENKQRNSDNYLAAIIAKVKP